MALFTLGGVFRTLATVFILLLLIQAQKRRRRVRQIPGQCDEIPELSKSRLCRCLHRPNSTGNYVSPPNDTYVISNVPIDYLNFGPQNFPNHSDTICVYFGHAGASVSLSLVTQEFAMEAVNEHGWPTGTWLATDFKGVCVTPTSVQRITIGNETLYDYEDCYDEDITLGSDEGWYTESSQYFNPNLFHYHYPVTRKYGMSALLYLNRTDVDLRPKMLKFVVEAPFIEPSIMNKPDLFRMESISYDVNYLPGDIIELVPSSGPNIEVNLDYAYQIRPRHPPSGREWCLEPPPPPPQIPFFDEMMCTCFLRPRQPLLEHVGTNVLLHNRLNLSSTIPPFFNNSAVAPELTDYFNYHSGNGTGTIGNFFMYSPTGPGLESYLVILTAVLPVYRRRTWREREFAMGDYLFNGGLPVGRFINPHHESTGRIYDQACDEAVASLNDPKIKWTRPPYPAVGKCLPHDKTLKPENQPCYFHFHNDYYFVDCVDSCDEPKYICAVWTFDDNTTRPFEFQFISNHVYYENRDASEGNWLLPVNSPCSAATTPGVKNWNLLEVHLFNEAYHKRSDLWIYNPYVKPSFKFIDVSNQNSDSIASESYLNETSQIQQIEDCVVPASYFLEIKDNNLCRCTFWRTNVDSWQTHYGRHSSCTHGAHTKDFREHFKIEFHSRQPDNVKVRVYADVVSEPRLLDDYFVLHAVYIQAFDQHGIPVGLFHKGHWFDASNTADQRCPSNQFPSNTDQANKRYPIFDIIDCNKHPPMPDIGVPGSAINSNLFLYQNRWRDNFPSVCAQYTFKKKDFPHVTRVQFLAFLRIEDKFDDGEAYMVELRSETLNASNFAASPPTEFATGVHEDRNVSYPPLNYRYYRNTLTAKADHWERPCLEPVKEPDRLFDVCRHFVTTPDTHPPETKRLDLDKHIDLYNHNCVQWINANINFGSSHQYTQELAENLKNAKITRDYAILLKKCFSLQAFRTRRKNAWHVRFRANSTADPYCENFDYKYLKEAALVAYNENGYPTGRPGGKREFGGSFELYNFHETHSSGRHEHCAGDDIELSLDDEINNNRMAFFEEKGMCWWEPNRQPAYAVDLALFHQDFQNGNYLDYIPSLFLWGNFARILPGFCAIWFFPNIEDLGKVSPPKYIQFVLEAQILHTGQTPPAPDPQGGRIITIRSPKYLFTYDSTSFMHVNPPNPRQDSVHPSNLDASVSDQCHGVELPIEYLKRPDDDCVCELRSQGSTTTSSQPGTGLAPLCTVKYEFYNHIQDNKLYRLCLAKEDPRRGNEDFPLDDCRTKLEYPRPPEVFPNEIIRLQNVEEDNFTNIVDLDPFDPTDEAYYGCGLIKRCISRYSSDAQEEECIRDKSCGLIITFGKGLGEAHHPEDEITIEIFAVARGWAAVAISPNDELMGEDYVMECTKEGGEVNVYHSWNKRNQPTKKENRVNIRMRGEYGLEHSISPNIRPVKTVFYQDKLYCKFYIKKRFTIIDPDLGEKHEYDLDKFYFFNSAFSHALTEPYGEERGNLRTHHLNGGQSVVGKVKIAAGERLSPLPHETRRFRLHALFMTLAWMFFMTLSIFVARYFKETLINTKILKMEFWYFVHIVTGGLACICLALGVMFQLSASHLWRSVFRSNFHTYSGILAFCLFCSEIVIGCFMKRTLDVKKPILNWLHTVMGHFAYNISLLNMIFSDRVAFGFLACNFGTYIWVWVAVYYILHAVMSYHYCWVDYILGRSINSRQHGTYNVLTQGARNAEKKLKRESESRRSLRMSRKLHDLVTRRNSLLGIDQQPERVEAPGKYVRMVALVMFTLITVVYTFWAIRKLVTYPRFCYDFYQLKYLEEHGFN